MINILLASHWTERLALFTGNPWVLVSTFTELLCFVVGLVFWKKFKATPVALFILFLGYNFFNEMAALLYYVSGLGNNNSIFFNIRQFIYFGVHFYLFYYYLHRRKLKLVIQLFYLVWLSSFVYVALTTNIILKYAVFPSILGDFLILISILFLFVEIINSSKIAEVQSDILIYIGLGLLVYLVVSIPTSVTTMVGWVRIGKDTGAQMEFYRILRNVGTITGALMYCIFAYGFYRSKEPEIKVLN